jgi:RNA polymerase sigma-70 factor, ECF subfamily
VTLKPPHLGLALAAEASIVALAQAGDQVAFAELVRRRQASIRGLLRRLCRDAALADDLSQDTFLQAWRQMERLRAPGAFGGWLRQIAVSTFLQHARKGRLPGAVEYEPVATNPAEGVALDLDAALAHLAADARLCIVLAYHEGLSHGEIATTTGIPMGTVKSHISRGATRLKQLLSSYDRS